MKPAMLSVEVYLEMQKAEGYEASSLAQKILKHHQWLPKLHFLPKAVKGSGLDWVCRIEQWLGRLCEHDSTGHTFLLRAAEGETTFQYISQNRDRKKKQENL